MFSQVLQWGSLAMRGPSYGSDPRAEGMVDRLLAAARWEDLSEDDRAFLTACIREVERGESPFLPTYRGDFAAMDAAYDAAEASGKPDMSGPAGGKVFGEAPDGWVPENPRVEEGFGEDDPLFVDGDTGEDVGRDAPEGKGYEFPDTDEGWIGL